MPSRDLLFKIIDVHSQLAELGLDLPGVMSLVAERTLDLVDAEGAAVELAEGHELVYRAVAGVASDSAGLRVPIEGSLSGLCLRAGQPLVCMDTELDDRVDLASCRRVGARSMAVIPLRFRQGVVGVLKAMSPQPGHFGHTQLKALELLSKVVGSAMHWASHYGQDDLFRRATHDDLTGLANRALFRDRLSLALSQTSRRTPAVAVLAIDMDGLKQINDELGHAAGDAALVEFARRLRAAARETDTVARLGGDEFVVLLSPSGPGSTLQAALQRYERAIDGPLEHQGHRLWLGGSVGSALWPQDGQDADALLAQADRRMYQVKRQRKSAADGVERVH